MGTRCSISLYALSEAEARTRAQPAIADVARLEAKYSRYLEDSFLSELNRVAATGGAIEVDAETASLLDYAQTCFVESEGLFDVTSGLLRRAWNFQPEGQTALPRAPELDALLARVGWDKLVWQDSTLRFPCAGMELDLGGLVKEYAVDRAVALLSDAGVRAALVNLGGDIAVTGPRADGRPWRVAIENPSQPGEALRNVELTRGALASSGSYARSLEIEGVSYGHLLHPRTGFPLSGTLAASVVADQCIVAGSLATIALLKEGSAREFLSATQLPFLLFSADGTLEDRLQAAS